MNCVLLVKTVIVIFMSPPCKRKQMLNSIVCQRIFQLLFYSFLNMKHNKCGGDEYPDCLTNMFLVDFHVHKVKVLHANEDQKQYVAKAEMFHPSLF